MTNKEEFDYFTEQLYGNAVKAFRETEQSALLREKLDRMEKDCETMLTQDQQEFAEECFEIITDANGQEEIYIYRKGLSDCVEILKSLGVLA